MRSAKQKCHQLQFLPARMIATVMAAAIAVGMAAAATTAMAQEPPRKNTQYFPFKSLDPSTGEAAFDSFVLFTQNMLNRYGDQLKGMSSEGGEQKSLDHLASLKLTPNTNPSMTITTEKLRQLWTQPQVLQIWTGNVFNVAEESIIVTDAYLGGAKGKLPSELIQLEQVYSYRAINENKNSHLALTVYALAMDMKNNGYSVDTVLTFLQEAKHLASVLEDGVGGHRDLKVAIDGSISELLQ